MGSRGILNFFSHLTGHFGVCLDHIAITLRVPVHGLDWHLRRSRITELDHEELLLLLTLLLTSLLTLLLILTLTLLEFMCVLRVSLRR